MMSSQLAEGPSSISMCKLSDDGVVAVFFPPALFPQAKRYWQHAGEILTSRVAEEQLIKLEEFVTLHSSSPIGLVDFFTDRARSSAITSASLTISNNSAALLHPVMDEDMPCHPAISPNEIKVQRRIADIVQCHAEDVVLTVTGMAAIFSTLRLLQRAYLTEHSQPMETAVFGFPYLDSLKVMQRPELCAGTQFFGFGEDADLTLLEAALAAKALGCDSSKTFRNVIGAVFVEFPSNPLLKCANLRRLRDICNRYGVLLVIDDTIASFVNVDLLRPGAAADIQVTSLTKIFSGKGNIMGGSLLLNPASPAYAKLHVALQDMKSELDLPWLGADDMAVLEDNSRDYVQRCKAVDTNALALAIWLDKHALVKKVYYPGLHDGNDIYKDMMRTVLPNGESWQAGYGCLLSIDLADGLDVQAFYDALALNKGPSLGTNFTLICPYTMLAHYLELPWAEEYGVSAELIRVSVGLEELQPLLDAFEVALQAAVRK